MKLFLLFLFICGAWAKGIAEEAETTLSCETNVCQNGGLCTSDGRGDHWCTCPHGFWGVYCEKEFTYAANKEDCHCKNGRCVEENGKLKCVCNSEFGLYSKYECKVCDCGKNMNCTFNPKVMSDGKKCMCPAGYVDIAGKCKGGCRLAPCKRGTCEDGPGTKFKCICPEGYFGEKCEIKDPCTSSPCKNGGTCRVTGDSYKCECKEPFYGDICEKKECTCENGKCIDTNDGTKCVCNPEYGPYKEGVCKACHCGPGANCTFDIGLFIDDIFCICPSGYKVEGEKCIPYVVSPSSSGTTTELPSTLTEIVESTSEAIVTELQSTPESTIIHTASQSFGTNSTITGTATSTLQSTVTGSQTTLANTNASSHQHLFSTDGVSSKIPSTTSGYQTTLDCGCQNGLCTIDIYGNLNCVCNPQYAKNGRGICTPCFCGQDANCEFILRGASIQKRCFCPNGYEDSNGYCTDINECLFARTCPKNTRCQNTEGSYDCFCREGYRPNNRTSNVKYDGCVAVCNSTICKNGECQVDGYSYFCKCDNGFTGRRCEEKISDNRIMDIIEIQSPWIILSALLLIIFLAFIFIHRNKSVKKNTFIFSSADDKCPLFEDPKFVNRLQTEILE